jgi:hypothetical protein
MSSFTHIHVTEESRDCDGGHGYYNILWPYEWNGRMIDAAELWYRKLASLQGWLAIHPGGKLKGKSGQLFFSAPTDEGYRSEYAYKCSDDCEGNPASQWDEYAEAMGY